MTKFEGEDSVRVIELWRMGYNELFEDNFDPNGENKHKR